VPSLYDLAQQGDPGTLQTEQQARDIKLLSPQRLYELWERQPWASQEIDFSRDRGHWADMSAEERDYFTWGMSAFFIGEERVTTEFSGLVMAYDDEQEEAFLTTQQVDEARHMQFFDRFYREVIGVDDERIGDRLAKVREHLNDSFVKLFDEALVAAGQRLVADPRDVEAKIDFVATYHMVIEGTLALTGQNFLTEYLEREQKLPGFVEGFKNVARDEHRHVAYGTWFLKQAAERDPAVGERIRATLRELLPIAAGVLVPPGRDPNDWEMLGYTNHDFNGFAFGALTRRMSAIGVPLVAGEPAPA
jgi:ribonucleoside-diphosphate reductase beta chain